MWTYSTVSKRAGFAALVAVAFALTPNLAVFGAPVAFPGAEGFGAYAKGGRGGDVYTVTNVEDSGPGSLREGIRSSSGPRTIVFAVSGLIDLESKLKIDRDFITIAGQTAPGDGICVRNYTFEIAADHVIVRYIRSRLGDQAGQVSDAITITNGHNIIVDHCSASWSVDETLSCQSAEGNFVYGFPEISADNWSRGIALDDGATEEKNRSKVAFDYPSIVEQSPEEAYLLVLSDAGASFARDGIDRRIVDEVARGEAKLGNAGLIDSPDDVGGWPDYRSTEAPTDSDMDGMPDLWEKANGLNPKKASDRNGYDLSTGFTNLEMYLNGVVR